MDTHSFHGVHLGERGPPLDHLDRSYAQAPDVRLRVVTATSRHIAPRHIATRPAKVTEKGKGGRIHEAREEEGGGGGIH